MKITQAMKNAIFFAANRISTLGSPSNESQFIRSGLVAEARLRSVTKPLDAGAGFNFTSPVVSGCSNLFFRLQLQ
jgi:hypothetical protein